jgi:hypothetical protein
MITEIEKYPLPFGADGIVSSVDDGFKFYYAWYIKQGDKIHISSESKSIMFRSPEEARDGLNAYIEVELRKSPATLQIINKKLK